MRIRITGKGLKKYQNAGPVTASGQPVMYNKVMLRPGQSYTDPQTGKITTYEQALKKINDIENENVRTQASLDALKKQDDAERAGDLADFNRHETVKVSSIPSASASIPKTFPSIQPFPAPTSFTGSMPNMQQAPMVEPDKVDLSGFKPPVIAGYKEQPLVAPVDPQEEAAKKAEADFRAKNPNAPINPSTMPGLADQVAQRADPTGYEMDQRIKNDPKYARQLKRSLKGNDTYKTIGKASNALTGAIYAAGALTDFVDNKNKQNDFKSYMRDQQMSDNLYPVQQGSRGDYVQTGTSYGAFRPDQMTVNKGMFAKMGGELNTETMKIRIISGPAKMEYGGQTKNGYSLDLGQEKFYEQMYGNPMNNMSSSMSEIENPNEPYVLETEGGEEVLRPDGTKFRLVGDSHANGGIKNTASQIPSGSYIYSKKLKESNPEILSKFNKTYKRGGVSYSNISSQYDLNKFKSILDDPNADPLSKSTAQMMSDNYKKKLGQLALVQEAKKGFKEGIPQVYTNSLEQAAYGGYVPMFATGGSLPETEQIDPYAGGKEKTPTGKSNKYDRGKDYLENWEKFIPGISKLSNKEAQSKIYDLIYQQNPNAINEMWTKYGLTKEGKKYKDLNSLAKDGRFTKQLGLDQLKDLKKAYVDGFFGARQLDPSAIPPPPPPPVAPPPVDPPSVVPPPKTPPLVPPTETPGKKIPTPYDFLAPDKMSMVAAGMNPPKKYLPYFANYAANIPTPTFYSPERELAANAEQANIMSQGLSNVAGSPGNYMTNISAIQGKAAEQATNTLGRYNNLNVGVANQFSPMVAEAMNKQAMYAAERTNELFKGNVIANQQYDNSKRAYFTNLTKSYANAWNNRMNFGDMNDNMAYMYKDPRSGRNVFKGPIGDISSLGMYGSSMNMGQTGVSNLGSIYNNLYNNYLSQLKDSADMTPEEKKKQAANLANLGLRSMQQTRTVNSRNPFMFNQRSTGFTGMDPNNFDDDFNNDIL